MFFRMYKVRLGMSVVGVFLVSMVMSCQELRYMTFGKTVDAKLMDSHLEKERRDGEEYEKRVVGYSFMDGDRFRREYMDVPVNWSNGGRATVKVQYLPGRDFQSRLYGTKHMGWVVVFLASLVVGVAGLVWMAREG